ncbi:MAG: IclR family transcriptional regulator [Chloroflexi bacterium]|nr:IclR family transcriptional regulator [Chloroflexota bacterium]
MPRRRTQQQIESVKSTVQSVDRALSLLEVLAESPQEMAIRDLSARVELHGSTVHRLLTALMARGFVRQNAESGRYSLGLTALRVGGAVQFHKDLRAEAKRYLAGLAAATGESANLVILDQGEAVYIEQAPGSRSVRMFTIPGARAPLHCTGAGKVLLAALSQEDRARIVAQRGLASYTCRTIVGEAALERELEAVRQAGYAIDNQEREIGVRCVAAPVHDAAGEVVAAISISGPSERFRLDRREQLVAQVQHAAAELSAQLGYRCDAGATVASVRRSSAGASGFPRTASTAAGFSPAASIKLP